MTDNKIPSGLKRRGFIAGTAAAVGAAALGFPYLNLHAQNGTLKVGTYGGYFKDSFDQHIYPDFTAATGIRIESIAEPTGEAWLVQLRNAARAGVAPADVNMMAGTPMLRGALEELWLPLDEARLPNVTGNMPDNFIHRYPDGRLYGAGAVSWYITLCSNTAVIPEAPESWADMWDERYRDTLGLLALSTNSFLLEITAKTFFGGYDILGTQEGIEQVLARIAELKPNVRLWYRDEGTFQQALQDGEIPMGQYYHDVAGLAAAQGFPVRSTFPREGGVLDSGSWVVTRASTQQELAEVFIDYTAQPEIQSLLARNVGTAPVIARDFMDLSDEEFAAVSSDIEPVLPQYSMYLEHGDWISDRWNEMIIS